MGNKSLGADVRHLFEPMGTVAIIGKNVPVTNCDLFSFKDGQRRLDSYVQMTILVDEELIHQVRDHLGAKATDMPEVGLRAIEATSRTVQHVEFGGAVPAVVTIQNEFFRGYLYWIARQVGLMQSQWLKQRTTGDTRVLTDLTLNHVKQCSDSEAFECLLDLTAAGWTNE